MSLIILNVDEVRRALSVSDAGAFVVNDKNVDIVRFALLTGFTDIALDEHSALRVMYQRPGETQVRAQTLTYYDTDGIRNYFDWELLAADLAEKGTLTVALCILRTDSTVEEWHTTPYQIRVLGSIHTDDSDEGDETITPTVAQRVAVLENVVNGIAGGAPIVVASTSAMTDTEQIYVLSTDGNWYYHNGSAWVAGGTYGAVATDTTLSQSGIPADAKAVGDKIADLKEDLIYIEDNALVVNNPSKPSEGGYDELVNIFDPNDLARTGSIYVGSTTPSIYTHAAFYQSGAIKTTPGETLQCIGQMNGTTDFWVAVLSTNDATSLSNVVRCYQVYPSRTYDGTISYAEIVVPDDAEWMSFSGLNRKNMDLIKINRTVHIPGPTYVNRIEYNGMDTPIKGLTPDFAPVNLFDKNEMTSGILFITGSNGQPAIYTGSNIGNFFQSAPIAVTAGETLVAYGNMNNAIDFWASVLEDDSSIALENVRECFRIYPQKSVDSKSYAIFKVPSGAQWISVSGAVYNAQIVQVYRANDTVSIAEEYGDVYELRDPFAIHFDKNITLSEAQKAVARTALGIVGSDGNVVTPQAYGALADGIHDDTEAIQAALNSSAKKIYLPPGGYRITDSLVISSGSKYLMGDGSNVAKIIPDDECGDAIIINESAVGTHLYGFLIETTNNEDAYAIRINNAPRVSISFVDNLGGSFRESKSKWLHQEGATWSTLMIYHCIVDCGTLDDWAAELINTSSSPRTCDVHMNDIFLDTVLATSAGCLRVDNCGDVHIQNSLYRTKAGACLQMDNNSRVINEMSVLETFTANKPSVVVNSGTFQNRGGWNDKYDPA